MMRDIEDRLYIKVPTTVPFKRKAIIMVTQIAAVKDDVDDSNASHIYLTSGQIFSCSFNAENVFKMVEEAYRRMQIDIHEKGETK
jgi:hypothetical protein